MNPADPSPVADRPLPRKAPIARARERWRHLSADRRRRLRGLLALGVVLTLAFAQPLASLMVYASGKDLHSHILLVPFISGYLLAIKRRELPREYRTSPAWAGGLAVVGLLALGTAWYLKSTGFPLSTNDSYLLPVLGYVCLLGSAGFLFLGRHWMAAAAFPLVFLLFLLPMPDAMADVLENASRLASAEAASWFLKLAGVPFLRDDHNSTVFSLPGIRPIMVAKECSGIRSSWVLFITSLIASHMFLKSPWRRTVFVTLVIPLGILRNGFRILVISWLCVEYGPQMIHHWIHHRGGPVFFVLSLIPLFLALWWLRRGENRRAGREAASRYTESG